MKKEKHIVKQVDDEISNMTGAIILLKFPSSLKFITYT